MLSRGSSFDGLAGQPREVSIDHHCDQLLERDLRLPPKHAASSLSLNPTLGPPQHNTTTATARYGTAAATSWERLHPRLTHRGS